MADSSTAVIDYLAELLLKHGVAMWENPLSCRNVLMDLLGAHFPDQTPHLVAVAFVGYPLKLWQAATAGITLALTLTGDQQTLLEKRFTAEQIQDGVSSWREAISKLQKTAMTSDEKDLINMVIVPKVKTGELNSQSEQEIYEAAAVKDIPRSRTGELIESYLTQYEAIRLQSESNVIVYEPVRLQPERYDTNTELATISKIRLTPQVGGILVALIAIPLGIAVIFNSSGSSPAPSSSPPAQNTPAPTPVPTADPEAIKNQVQSVIQNWQTVKRNSFVNGTTGELNTVLTGKMLEETIGGVNWWKNNGTYHNIELHNLNFINTKISGNAAKVRASISETKSNSVNGRATSSYIAIYSLLKQGDSWYITAVETE